VLRIIICYKLFQQAQASLVLLFINVYHHWLTVKAKCDWERGRKLIKSENYLFSDICSHKHYLKKCKLPNKN